MDSTVVTLDVCMQSLSGVGIKTVLPYVIRLLQQSKTHWRERIACCVIIGHFCHNAPKQITRWLHVLITTILKTMSDIKKDVSEAAFTCLKRLGSVVSNPNVIHCLPMLFDALNEPSSKTIGRALDKLAAVKFTHTLDSPGIAMIIPCLLRGMKNRDVNICDLSAKMVGFLFGSFVESSQVNPYLPDILPVLRKLLLGQHPEVRSSSAKAIGVLAKLTKVEESSAMQETMDWINGILKEGGVGSIEREATAMAFCEVISASGIVSFHFDEIMSNCNHPDSNIREGFLRMLYFLPKLMEREDFKPFLASSLHRTLQGLADDAEIVRDICFNSSLIMIKKYGMDHLDMLLPVLLLGIQNERWMTRMNCLKLLGEFLQKIHDEHDLDNSFVSPGYSFVTVDVKVLREVLGEDITDKILALLFIIQCDDNMHVRQQCTNVWRSLIEKRVVVLNDILSCLLDVLIEYLSHQQLWKRRTAGKACALVVENLGESIVHSIIPLLTSKMTSKIPETRQGVCVGLTEIMKASSPYILKKYSSTLLTVVQRAISDEVENVQLAASFAFNELLKVAGKKVVKTICNQLLRDLRVSEKKYSALSGLKYLAKVSSGDILPFLVPALLKNLTDDHLIALGTIAPVSGYILNDFLADIAANLAKIIGKKNVTNVKKFCIDFSTPLLHAISQICDVVHDSEDSVDMILEQFCALLTTKRDFVKRGTCLFVQVFCFSPTMGKIDVNKKFLNRTLKSNFISSVFESLIGLFDDSDDSVVEAVSHTLTIIIDQLIHKEEYCDYIEILKRGIHNYEGKESLRLFSIKGTPALMPLVKIYQVGLLHRSSEIKELSILGIRDIILLTSQEMLERNAVKMTGPLVRIAGYRVGWQIKVVILDTLLKLVERGGKKMMPFTPQLQTIFSKSVKQGANETIRKMASEGLEVIISLRKKKKALRK